MREALDTRTMDHPPALEEIVASLGPFTSQGDGTGDDEGAPRRTSRRGRRGAS
jgi:5-methyltetrahydrofolate--homocysteine methyltransferase